MNIYVGNLSYSVTEDELKDLAARIRDQNYRIFVARNQLQLLNSQTRLEDADAFELFRRLLDEKPKNMDASHAFYLGFELAKATMSLQLGKQYNQDQPLDWGYLNSD